MRSVPAIYSLSFRYLTDKLCDPRRNLCRCIRLACWYELEGGGQSAHVLLFQRFPLRSPDDDAATFLHGGQSRRGVAPPSRAARVLEKDMEYIRSGAQNVRVRACREGIFYTFLQTVIAASLKREQGTQSELKQRYEPYRENLRVGQRHVGE